MLTHPNYQIIRLLGEGGMAKVYLANDIRFQTHVAIKLLNPDLTRNENIRKRFIAEARNLYRMSHPGIIKVTDLIDDGQVVAFVMEYIDGETLKSRLERTGKPAEEQLPSLMQQMLEALKYIHECGLIHRDIKPSNFMVTQKNRIKLMDFGIAKVTDPNQAEYTQTGTHQHLGTPMYMSPEQVLNTRDVTIRSDIYAIGVVLWQMVAGKKPYDSSSLSVFQIQSKIVHEPLEPTGTRWDSIIQKATSKLPEDRIGTAEEFLERLQELTLPPQSAPQPTAPNLIPDTDAERTILSDLPEPEIPKKPDPEPKAEMPETEEPTRTEVLNRYEGYARPILWISILNCAFISLILLDYIFAVTNSIHYYLLPTDFFLKVKFEASVFSILISILLIAFSREIKIKSAGDQDMNIRRQASTSEKLSWSTMLMAMGLLLTAIA